MGQSTEQSTPGCRSFSLDGGLWDSLHLAMSFIQSGHWSTGQSAPGYVAGDRRTQGV